MATWIIHLRIADKLIDLLPVAKDAVTEFVVGNIAPDSGVPTGDGYTYVPSADISHYKRKNTDTHKMSELRAYMDDHYTYEKLCGYDEKQYGFYTGYLCHLATDILWKKCVIDPCERVYSDEMKADRVGFIWKMKGDWYSVDHAYLAEHPSLRSYEIYKNAKGFKNSFVDAFSEDAFDAKRASIISFYENASVDENREYKYFTPSDADRFVSEATDRIASLLKFF